MKNIFASIIVIVFSVTFFISCQNEEQMVVPPAVSPVHNALQAILDAEYDNFKKSDSLFKSGVAVQVLSQKGNFFLFKGLNAGSTNQIHFRAASNTKTFTAAPILLLAERGKLNIQAKLIDTIPGQSVPYLPAATAYAIPNTNSIRIWDLLTHRAGVYDLANDNVPDTVVANAAYKGKNYLEYVLSQSPNHTFTLDELIAVNAVCNLSYFVPGTRYKYSNTGYTILAKIIERVSGKSYKQFVMDEFVTPLKLTETTFPDQGTDQSLPVPFASGFVSDGSALFDVTQSNMTANVAEGNVITTPENLSRFLRLLLRGEGGLSSVMINNTMMDCRPTNEIGSGGYGAGIFYKANLGYGHSGAHVGYLSLMVYDPASGFTFAAFTNHWDLSRGLESMIVQLNMLEIICQKMKMEIVQK